jgi:hypothetical protein
MAKAFPYAKWSIFDAPRATPFGDLRAACRVAAKFAIFLRYYSEFGPLKGARDAGLGGIFAANGGTRPACAVRKTLKSMRLNGDDAILECDLL